MLTLTVTGWGYTLEPPSEVPSNDGVFLPAIPIVVAAVAAFAAALVLALRAARPGGPGRLLAIAGAGLIVGAMAPVVTGVGSGIVNANADITVSAGWEQTFTPGLGTWLLTAAMAGVLVVVALLLVPARDHLVAAPVQAPYGYGYPPPYQPGPPGWPDSAPQPSPHPSPHGPAP
jgi:hypothetical protein